MKRKEVQVAVQNIIDKAPFTLVDLAKAAGISYDSLRSWSIGRRTPRDSTKQKLVDGLRRKSADLARLADELDRTT
jgi:predicted transcriptional regulator